MPIYEYRCCDCEDEFDTFTTFENRYKVRCPNCGSNRIKILISKLGYMKHPTQVAEKAATITNNK
jgi:putative FmdB family regulatory protein